MGDAIELVSTTSESHESPRDCERATTNTKVRAGAHAGYRPDVDGLRALAVLSVIVFHFDGGPNYLPGGFVGVDIFFVISGYVVAGSLLRPSSSSTPGHYLLAFYARRLKRLSPALIFVIVFTSLLTAILVDPAWGATTSYYESGMLGLVGIANNFFASLHAPELTSSDSSHRRLGNAYFANTLPTGGDNAAMQQLKLRADELHFNPYLHLWSLGVEEQYYFIFPAILLLAHGCSVPRRNSGRMPVVVLTCIFVLGIAISAWLSQAKIQLAFFIMPTRLWELLAGAILYALLQRIPDSQSTDGADTSSERISLVGEKRCPQEAPRKRLVHALVRPGHHAPHAPDGAAAVRWRGVSAQQGGHHLQPWPVSRALRCERVQCLDRVHALVRYRHAEPRAQHPAS